MKHMCQDAEHELPPLGYKLGIGDTVKFGRVRYKVIMMHNDHDGETDF